MYQSRLFLPRSNILDLLVLTSENEGDWLCIIFYFTGFAWNKHKAQKRSPFFRDVVSCHCITDAWCYKAAYWSYHQENWTFPPLQTWLLSCLKMRVTNYPVSWCHILEKWRPQLQSWKTLKTHTSPRGSIYIINCIIVHWKFSQSDSNF